MKSVPSLVVHPALKQALQTAPDARKIFDSMPPSHQRQYNQWVGQAKKPETQKARAKKSLEMIEVWGKNRKK